MEPRISPTGQFPKLAAHIWRAPLVPVALALTFGILLDRYLAVPLALSFGATAAALLAWTANLGTRPRLAIGFLWAACAGIGATYHHTARGAAAASDLSHLATEDAQPARLRGTVDTEPNYVPGSGEDPLRSFPTSASTRFVLNVSHLKTTVDWLKVSGLAQVILEAKIHPVHVGDQVEMVGRMFRPHAPANPGEFDYPALLRDQGIGTVVTVPPSAESILLRAEGWPRSLHGWLGVVRGWGQEVLARHLPDKVSGVAGALLLGDDAGMTRDDWDKYARTGVIHVLAISGQHLVVLSCFLWALMRFFWVPRRKGIVFIAVFLLLYALMSGGRPPVMRAAWAMAAYCGAVWLQRQVLPANTFALAWILVIIANPGDIFSLGCQLSFLAVATLIWGTKPSLFSAAFLAPLLWRKPAIDPQLQKLIDESRPLAVAFWIRLQRWVFDFYLVNATVWLAVTPLVAGTQHMVSPVALLIGPPLVLFTSIALISGFVMLLSVPFGLAAIFSYPVHWSLAGCEHLVDGGASLPCSYFYVADLPAWWLWVCYLALFTFLTVSWLREPLVPVLRFCPGLGGSWEASCSSGPLALHAFRCTFLGVGHGGCTVLETADGRVLLYDAGAIGGPDVTRRQIAPYLWRRGIGRIDDLYLSHADLDHFNGVTALLERFKVKRVTMTPSFADRITTAVRMTMDDLRARGIPTRVVKAGDILGEETLPGEVLHPPLRGPEGNENARSLVILLKQENLSILLTGDLEGPGLARVLALPKLKIDILMAPHHGSKTSNNPDLSRWAKPKVVISSQGPPRGNPKTVNPYGPAGITYLTTWKHGAVTISKEKGKWVVETYQSKKNVEVQ